jgi:hypothetical protein
MHALKMKTLQTRLEQTVNQKKDIFQQEYIPLSLVETPPFCNCNFNYCSTTKTIANFFLQLGNVFLNYKPTKSISTSRERHYS